MIMSTVDNVSDQSHDVVFQWSLVTGPPEGRGFVVTAAGCGVQQHSTWCDMVHGAKAAWLRGA